MRLRQQMRPNLPPMPEKTQHKVSSNTPSLPCHKLMARSKSLKQQTALPVLMRHSREPNTRDHRAHAHTDPHACGQDAAGPRGRVGKPLGRRARSLGPIRKAGVPRQRNRKHTSPKKPSPKKPDAQNGWCCNGSHITTSSACHRFAGIFLQCSQCHCSRKMSNHPLGICKEGILIG